MTLVNFFNLLETVGIPVAHYETELQEYPYIIYNEFASNFIKASNIAYNEKTKVEVIHFSQTEFDVTFETLKEILLNSGIFFSVVTTYDRENKVIQNQLEVELLHEVGGKIG